MSTCVNPENCDFKSWNLQARSKGFHKMHDCYLNYETRLTKLENLNKVWIDTGIEI